jgi:hypothetical protein
MVTFALPASQMNKVPSKYWQPEPALTTLIQQESQPLIFFILNF